MVDKVGDISGSSPKELALLPCSSSTAGPSPTCPAIAAADVASSKPNVSNVSNTYPQPLATYEDVVANPKVFMSTLEKLHAAMRTKFMIPIIGGKELDLHRLFVEVTSRGGIEKVVRERRWREITSVFKFPSTATNASFILRKYYVSLILHYEQLYYFGAKGWNRSESDPLLSTSPTTIPAQGSVPPVASSEPQVSPTPQPSKVNAPLGSPVVGVIDGKFEHGYLVTVSVGTQKLHGVLYHISENQTSQTQQNTFLNTCNSGRTTTPLTVHRRRRRKKSEMKKRDPSHPKPNRSGYNFFFQEHHARLKPLHPGKDREISKMIGELWSKLTETEKAVYQEKGLRDKERYQSEMQEYRERLQRSQVISDAVPIQQVHAQPEALIAQPEHKMEVDEDKQMEVDEDKQMEVDGDKLDPEEDPSDEDEQMEDDSPHTPENGSISDGSDSEVKTADKEPEMGVPVEAGNRTETCNVTVEDDGKKDEKVVADSSVQDLNL